MGEQSQNQALAMVYTGNGKGKTSAAVGQALRAKGSGLNVAFGQFLKRDDQAGEQKILKSLLGNDFFASGQGFYRNKAQYRKHRDAVKEMINWAENKLSKNYDLLILDEAIYALGMDLLKKEELDELMDKAMSCGTNLVLTGRNAPPWLTEKADMVSELLEVKHHFQKNISARKGIEF
ncbi:MAG: cob(I)yrinic acid a,c-diamide adenosyltransferase [Desulfonatronovibrio sp.]|nr:cob(I)yrinic acid a,c-diamide adenosyltransferase [Desulfovibrionales bacterium]